MRGCKIDRQIKEDEILEVYQLIGHRKRHFKIAENYSQITSNKQGKIGDMDFDDNFVMLMTDFLSSTILNLPSKYFVNFCYQNLRSVVFALASSTNITVLRAYETQSKIVLSYWSKLPMHNFQSESLSW